MHQYKDQMIQQIRREIRDEVVWSRLLEAPQQTKILIKQYKCTEIRCEVICPLPLEELEKCQEAMPHKVLPPLLNRLLF